MSDPRHVDIVYRLRQPVAHTTRELVGVAHLHAEAADRIVVLEGALGHSEREVERLQALLKTANAFGFGENAARLRAEAERDALARALHEIAEEWAGAECGEPVHAQEAYAIALAKRMYQLAVEARKT
jgi:hypothetical protein